MSKNKTLLTAEQKELFATQRKLLEKTVITSAPFVGYIVDKHIKGSLYKLINPDGTGHVFASHSKGVWKPWV
jgi:hypothetical protein